MVSSEEILFGNRQEACLSHYQQCSAGACSVVGAVECDLVMEPQAKASRCHSGTTNMLLVLQRCTALCSLCVRLIWFCFPK